jgi:hypothetical protein
MVLYFWVAYRWSRDNDVDFEACDAGMKPDVYVGGMVDAVSYFRKMDVFIAD